MKDMLSGLKIYQHKNIIYDYYRKFICRDEIDKLYIAWHYDKHNPLIKAIKSLKNANNLENSRVLAHNLGRNAWEPILKSVYAWERQIGRQLVIVPVPSHSGFSEALSTTLTYHLPSNFSHYMRSSQRVMMINDNKFLMKRVRNWRERPALSLHSIAPIREASSRKAVLLVDDIVASGSTLRACAKILVAQGVDVVGAAALFGDFDTFSKSFYKNNLP